MDEKEMMEILIDQGIATETEIQLVVDINGYNKEALRNILYSRTGYQDFDQLDLQNS